MKRYKALCCEALARGMRQATANSANDITIHTLRQGLHDTPKQLRSILQEEITGSDSASFDAILLAYGLCGNSTAGLYALETPLVIPRTHDCIAIYLGSLEQYNAEFERQPGTYWYSVDFLENLDHGASAQLGAAGISEIEDLYEEYVQKYGQKRADILVAEMKSWTRHYTRAVFIDTGQSGQEKYERIAQNRAAAEGWSFERIRGNWRLMQMLVDGDWNAEEFMVVPPGHVLRPAYDGSLMTAVPIS